MLTLVRIYGFILLQIIGLLGSSTNYELPLAILGTDFAKLQVKTKFSSRECRKDMRKADDCHKLGEKFYRKHSC